MLAFHIYSNAILVEPFQSKQDRHCLATYDHIMTRLKKRGHTVNLQILDNEYIQAYISNIEYNWNCIFQLVPPNFHRRNNNEREI